jgi:hypothetical protein
MVYSHFGTFLTILKTKDWALADVAVHKGKFVFGITSKRLPASLGIIYLELLNDKTSVVVYESFYFKPMSTCFEFFGDYFESWAKPTEQEKDYLDMMFPEMEASKYLFSSSIEDILKEELCCVTKVFSKFGN